ncbi:copper resistance protein CopC [Bacillus sp. V5-8f]|uniref:copper resistance protein CopC n=1 Tax=Bacillus sp. V5-8f TaxID=2053044 RepID=UPI000C780FC5|nr:copper resistance protein CopC [Bacillus sp. V5-8f]PLT32010.1 copper resistance protein [Bacillus sp. V5-8f]
MRNLKKCSIFLLLIYIFILFPKETFAHAYLVSSTPAENEILSQSPSKISLQFSEHIQSGFHSLVLLDHSGEQIKLNDAIGDDRSILEAKLKDEIVPGTYSIQWKVVSADGHPIHGTISFSVGAGQKETDIVSASSDKDYPILDIIVLRWLLYIGFSLFIGVIVCNVFIIEEGAHQPTSVRVIWAALIVFSIALLLNLPLQTTFYADVSWLEALRPSLLQETLEQTTAGTVWIFQLLLLVILFLFTCMATLNGSVYSVRNWLLPLLVSIGLLVSKSIISHAAGTENPILAVMMDFLHLLASSVWVGGLFTVVFLLPKARLDSEHEQQMYWKSIHRFSLWAIIAVAIILLTGMYGSLLYVPTWHSLFHSPYGKILLGKILLFFIMIILGAFHFWRGRKRGKKGISGTAWIELIMGVVVLILVAILTNLPTADSSPSPFKDTQQADEGTTVTLEISPNVEGQNTIQIDVKNPKGDPVTNIEQVSLTLSHTEMKMEENTIILSKQLPGQFQTAGMYLNMNGKWKLSVHVLTSSLDSYDVEFHPNVGRK